MKAIKIIEISMALNGISLVPVARDIVDVVGAGQNPRKAPVPIISDIADIPPGNPVVSVLFRLQYGRSAGTSASVDGVFSGELRHN